MTSSLQYHLIFHDVRRDFSEYASRSVEKLKQTIKATSDALESNKWLTGAKVGCGDITRGRRVNYKLSCGVIVSNVVVVVLELA